MFASAVAGPHCAADSSAKRCTSPGVAYGDRLEGEASALVEASDRPPDRSRHQPQPVTNGSHWGSGWRFKILLAHMLSMLNRLFLDGISS